MKLIRMLVLLLAGFAVLLPLAASRPPAGAPPIRIADPAIVSWVSQVSTERLAAAIGDLEGFQTRYVSTEGCASAGTYLFEAFRRFGLQVEYDPFSLGGVTTNNIVATLRGRAEPSRQVIVCAHYDSTSDQRWILAPGADDDGSGTAAVLEMARILAGGDFDLSLKFICFSGEEWGQAGSRHYVAEAQAAGETILGVINLDMIAYTDRRPWALTVIHNEPSTDLARRFVGAALEYAGLGVKTMAVSSFPYGDHAPFWDAGFVALCATETAAAGNPYIHTTADRLGTLTMDFARQGVQACLAVAAELARPAVVPAAPTGIVVRSQIGRSLYLRVKTVELRWDANRDSVAGYHIYRSTASGGPYQRLSSVPQAGLQFTDRYLKADTVYYYLVSAVDAQGRESRPSIEVADTEGAR